MVKKKLPSCNEFPIICPNTKNIQKIHGLFFSICPQTKVRCLSFEGMVMLFPLASTETK